MDENFMEFINYIEEEPYVIIPRIMLRDYSNPFETYSNIELLERVRFTREVVYSKLMPMIHLQSQVSHNNRGLPIRPEIKMFAALKFFATGCYQRVCADILEISQPSVSRICNEVIHLPTFIKFPEDINSLKRQFYRIATHIEIISPGSNVPELEAPTESWFNTTVFRWNLDFGSTILNVNYAVKHTCPYMV
ncbi:hypothetical protein HUJ05_001522 [Dendroctonus ponderosae]|nr:hypothetical protein HUJ05_001522 [Dendroctonus ponderosae]